MVVASAFSAPLSFSFASCHRTSSLHLFSLRNPSSKSTVSALQSPYGDSLTTGLSSRTCGSPLKLDVKDFGDTSTSYGAIEARKGNPPILPSVMTPGGPLDLSSVLFRNRIIFIGQPVNSLVAQRVISQLVTLATVDENADILVYLNCPGGSTYSVLAIYDCMSWIKPKVGTVCFGVAASQGALLLAGGEKGMRYAMPNARIMIHQPQSGCGGHVEDVRRQVNEAVQTRHKVDNMYVAFTGQSLEKVQQYTERDRFLSVSEAMEFGLIDGVLETEY
ncbi:ATP-dependent Clp protease proteolytic subunit 6, chloroplastic isoform X1 [Prunus avium]|uniref:ATP-dependent Clp protease proteolytic subunit n=1 Tax=Prunus avium TaxID=42229 RepID=A0A6P5S1E5_PRUAV|nr:ATP-dependent Clp protease proteolytic subunit 6, chloroplastic isoform X1 [Prunus avium]